MKTLNKINKEILHKLKPCIERWKNYLEHYSDFDGSLAEFLKLDKISYTDKIWVSRQIVDRKIYIRWGALCAQSVLHIYENKCPNDSRVRDCLDYLLSDGEKDITVILQHKHNCFAAGASYSFAVTSAAAAVTAAAAYAAAAYAVTAHSATAAYSAATYAAAAAADDAAADASRSKQQGINIELLISLLEKQHD